jgi:hypothetical protein
MGAPITNGHGRTPLTGFPVESWAAKMLDSLTYGLELLSFYEPAASSYYGAKSPCSYFKD